MFACAALSVSAADAIPVDKAGLSPFQRFSRAVSAKQASQRAWSKAAAPQADAQIAPDGVLEPASYFGTLFTPAGEVWTYTSEFDTSDNGSIEGVKVNVYDADFKLVSDVEFSLELGENDLTINQVDLAPQLTAKFFNYDSAYEIMVGVHATTADYMGRYYTKVYSLADGSHICDIDGNNIGCVNAAADAWSENYTLAFMRESVDENENYFLHFDVYGRAGWNSGITLKHTFDAEYSYISGSGGAAFPFLMAMNEKNKMVYALPHYQKPFFEGDDYFQDPTVTPDNSFVIDLYDENFENDKSVVIPMTGKEGYVYSFPGIGQLHGFGDMSFGQFGDTEEPAFIVTYENYKSSSDDYISDFYVYDIDGNKIATIYEEADDYLRMSDIKGFETQFCFYNAADAAFEMVDLPSCRKAAVVPINTDNGYTISTTIDRAPVGASYQYVSSINFADTDADGNAYHNIAWIGIDGKFDHMHSINLGQNVALALPYINREVLTPYVFNTDDKYEYMFLVKVFDNQGNSKSSEYLRIYNADSEEILSLGPDADGGILQSIFLTNSGTQKAKLVVIYSSAAGYTVKHFALPMQKFAMGDGTPENPYVLASAGDVMSMWFAPDASYVMANDIDFGNCAWEGNQCVFTGALDGAGHKISGLNIYGQGMFSQIGGAAVVSDLIIENSCLSAANGGAFLAGYLSGENAGKHPVVKNVRVYNSVISGDEDCYGAIAAIMTTFAEIQECSAVGCEFEGGEESVVGGMAGRMQTSASLSRCFFDGSIEACIAGGIVGEAYTDDGFINDCHVDAEIKGETHAGGVIGSSRNIEIKHCYVEGDIEADGDEKAYAGGLIGQLEAIFGDAPEKCITNNIVAVASIEANDAAEEAVSHRIVGYSSGDESYIDYENIDWENLPDDYDPDDLPRVPGEPEQRLANNYCTTLDVIDSDIADDDTTVEGKGVAYADLTDEFLAAQGWALGDNAENPWVKGAEGLSLYFEGKDGISGIGSIGSDAVASGIIYDGAELRADGSIAVYNAAGQLLMRGEGTVSVRGLASGVYVAVSANGSLKFSVR